MWATLAPTSLRTLFKSDIRLSESITSLYTISLELIFSVAWRRKELMELFKKQATFELSEWFRLLINEQIMNLVYKRFDRLKMYCTNDNLTSNHAKMLLSSQFALPMWRAVDEFRSPAVVFLGVFQISQKKTNRKTRKYSVQNLRQCQAQHQPVEALLLYTAKTDDNRRRRRRRMQCTQTLLFWCEMSLSN